MGKLDMLKATVQHKKQTFRKRKTCLTRYEEEEVIEATVSNILNEQSMVDEVRLKLYPKVQEKIHLILDQQLMEICQEVK